MGAAFSDFPRIIQFEAIWDKDPGLGVLLWSGAVAMVRCSWSNTLGFWALQALHLAGLTNQGIDQSFSSIDGRCLVGTCNIGGGEGGGCIPGAVLRPE